MRSPGLIAVTGALLALSGVSEGAAHGTSTAIRVVPEWTRISYGESIGLAGLHVVDLDGDGSAEIVASAARGYGWYWYVLKHQAGEYNPVWVGEHADARGPIEVRVANVDADPALEVLVAVDDEITVFDGVTRLAERVLVTPVQNSIRGLAVGELDGDPGHEVVFSEFDTLYVMDLQTGAVEYTGVGYGGQDVAVANVDGDAALEIVVTDASNPVGYVLDGLTHALEWENPLGFGDKVRLGDVDGDGRAEAVAYVDGVIRVFDLELQSVAGTIPTNGWVYGVRVLDVEGDGPLEIVYADDPFLNHRVYVHNGQDLSLKWSVAHSETGVTDFAVGDPDGDGTRELVFSDGYGSSAQDYLRSVDVATHAIEWTSLDFSGPFWGLAWGDVDADGQPEVVSAAYESRSGYGPGILFVHHAQSLGLEYVSPPLPNGIGHLEAVRTANVDADPQHEIFLGASGSVQSWPPLAAHDGLTHAVQWASTDNTLRVNSLQLANVDLDPALELVVGGQRLGDAMIEVRDARTGALEWPAPVFLGDLHDNVNELRVGNVDGDPQPEVVARASGALLIVDAQTRVVTDLGFLDVTSLELADRDGDGVAEILVGHRDGTIRRLGTSGQVLETVGDFGEMVYGLTVRDVTGDGVYEYLFAAQRYPNAGTFPDELRIHDAAGAQVWASGPIGFLLGERGSILVDDVDADGFSDILVNLGGHGFRRYEVRTATSQPSLSVSDTTVTEASGFDPTVAEFTVTLSAPSAERVVVQYATQPGTAGASDYWDVEGALVFEPGLVARTVRVYVLPDTVPEPNETFSLTLSEASGATVADGLAVATILDDDSPSLGIGDATAPEGGEGAAGEAAFTLTLSFPAAYPVAVSYATAPGTATAGADYGAVGGTVAFAPGEVSRTVRVPVFGDAVAEGNETFTVNLSPPTGAILADGQGSGTILDDDGPGLSISDRVVRERVGATATVTFVVTLAPTSASPVTVSYATGDGTATAGTDYLAAAGILTFDPGVPTQTASVTVSPDGLVEGAETFTVNLSGAAGAPVVRAAGTGRILDAPAGGDFNSDGKNDLVWRHGVSGQNVLWFMNGAQMVSGTFTSPSSLPDPAWRIVGSNDFNGDGHPDLLWRHAGSGQNVLWYMNGAVLQSGTFLTPAALADVRWSMSGTGDFNLDGRPDIVWRHGVSGENVVWYMNGSVLQSGTFLTPPALADVSWQMVGTGDFNLDGRSDILWRHAVSGQNVAWMMNDANLMAGTFLDPPALADVRWQMSATGDYDQDGRTDIVWRHALSGQNVLWFMNGTTLAGGTFTSPPVLADTAWKIVGPR